MTKKLALIPLGIFLALLAVELLLRLTGVGLIKPVVHLRERGRTYVERGLHVLDPHLFWRRHDGPLSPEERKMRLVTVGASVPRRSGKFRIICLGDSCTRLSRSGRPYSAQLEEVLGPDRVEVFNASLPGYTSHQGLVWLQRELLAYAPDLVVVYFGWNDHWRATGFTDQDYARRLQRWRPRLMNLLQPPADPPPARVSVAAYEDNLQLMARLVTGNGGRLLVLLAPHALNPANSAVLEAAGSILPGEDATALHLRYLEAARRLAGEPGVQIHDAAAIFTAVAEPDLLLMQDGIHPTDLGHSVLAVTLADAISVWCLDQPGPVLSPVAVSLRVLARSAAASGHWREAIRWRRRALAETPQDPGSRLGLAWLLATCPDATLRSSHEALTVLEPLEGGMAEEPRFLDVKAAALAAAGDFTGAVTLARRAIVQLEARGSRPALKAALRDRLAEYEAGRPYLVTAGQTTAGGGDHD